MIKMKIQMHHIKLVLGYRARADPYRFVPLFHPVSSTGSISATTGNPTLMLTVSTMRARIYNARNSFITLLHSDRCEM